MLATRQNARKSKKKCSENCELAPKLPYFKERSKGVAGFSKVNIFSNSFDFSSKFTCSKNFTKKFAQNIFFLLQKQIIILENKKSYLCAQRNEVMTSALPIASHSNYFFSWNSKFELETKPIRRNFFSGSREESQHKRESKNWFVLEPASVNEDSTAEENTRRGRNRVLKLTFHECNPLATLPFAAWASERSAGKRARNSLTSIGVNGLPSCKQHMWKRNAKKKRI